MYLIMNADDFGYTKSVTDGIVYAYQHGIIRSTTAMCNMPYIEYAGELHKEYPDLGVGLHLTISAGSPILKTHKTIVDEHGNFYNKSSIIKDKKDINIEEVYAEFEAQMQKFISVFGCLPDHIDGHHGCIMFDHIWPATEKLAKKFNLRVRRKTGSIQYYDYFYKDNVEFEHFKTIIQQYKNDNTYGLEIGCHPGFVDYDLYKGSSYNVQRLHELDFMLDEQVKQFLIDNEIELTNYSII